MICELAQDTELQPSSEWSFIGDRRRQQIHRDFCWNKPPRGRVAGWHSVPNKTETVFYGKDSSQEGVYHYACPPRLARARHRSQRTPGSKPDSTKDPPCLWSWYMLNVVVVQTSTLQFGAEVWRGKYQLRRRPRHLNAVQNYKGLTNFSPRVAPKRDVNITKLNSTYDRVPFRLTGRNSDLHL
ncbi:hypothetical protein AVEN_18328-1 [Araneus ventricosus]|uniref:Uncharacterized protein n=1 Tax=Araneus ventricosus TaxID=182803 RepID=A0A4Y2EP57_ARAVE|nr:hypothetical protein AVEN_18328-1 [Araneus ventricosus]